VINLDSPSTRRRLIVAASVLVAIICWIRPINDPLWLDEMGTYWVVKDSLRSTLERSFYWSNWSPFFLIEWLVVRVSGKSEIAMRLPSVLCMAIAAVFVDRIAARWWDEEAGLLAAAVFAGMPDIAFAAVDARPYAFALMALTVYAWALLRWIETHRFLDAVTAIVFAALTAYGHTILAFGLVAPALYALWCTTRPWSLVGIGIAVGVLLVPLAIQTSSYYAMAAPHVVGGIPTLDDLWYALAPPQLFATLTMGVLLAFWLFPGVRPRWGMSKKATIALALWIVLGPAIFFALARTTSLRLFVTRYLLSTAPALAVLFGSLIRAVEPVRPRALVALTMFVVSSVTFSLSAKSFHGDGWRDAMAAVRQEVQGRNIPVLISSDFVEARTPEQLADPKLKDVLFAQEFFYPPSGRVVHLLFRFDESHLAHITKTELAGEPEFLVVTYNDRVVDWFTRRLATEGYQSTRLGEFRRLQLYRFRLTSR
jgi:hypothetical protein